jgi:hypothetical protein
VNASPNVFFIFLCRKNATKCKECRLGKYHGATTICKTNESSQHCLFLLICSEMVDKIRGLVQTYGRERKREKEREKKDRVSERGKREKEEKREGGKIKRERGKKEKKRGKERKRGKETETERERKREREKTR